jgi:hypothetical protein
MVQVVCIGIALGIGALPMAHAQQTESSAGNPVQLAYFQPAAMPRANVAIASHLNVVGLLSAEALLTSASAGTIELLRYSIVASGNLARIEPGIFHLGRREDFSRGWTPQNSPRRWQWGDGGMLCYKCANEKRRFILGYGTVFNGPRESYEGDRSVGLRVQQSHRAHSLEVLPQINC